MRRKTLGNAGELGQNLGLAGGVAALMVCGAAFCVPVDRLGMIIRMTTPYSLALAGGVAFAVAGNARRHGYNEAVDRMEALGRGEVVGGQNAYQVQEPQYQQQAQTVAPQSRVMAQPAASAPAHPVFVSQPDLRGPQPSVVVPTARAASVAVPFRSQPSDPAGEVELY